jgi:hypothetical protein
MKKTRTAFFFFIFTTSSLVVASSCIAQSIAGQVFIGKGGITAGKDGQITISGDSIVLGKHGEISVYGNNPLYPGSLPFQWNRIPEPRDSMPTSHGDANKHYYLDVIPPTQKAKQVDHSNVWLLNGDVAQAWH